MDTWKDLKQILHKLKIPDAAITMAYMELFGILCNDLKVPILDNHLTRINFEVIKNYSQWNYKKSKVQLNLLK